MADYFRVFSYATKWDFCTYALACFASIGGGVAMPLSKSFQIQFRPSWEENGLPSQAAAFYTGYERIVTNSPWLHKTSFSVI